jgi:hypothetical protein
MIKSILNIVFKLKAFRVCDDQILDAGLVNAMKEVEDDEELDLEEAKSLSDFKNRC